MMSGKERFVLSFRLLYGKCTTRSRKSEENQASDRVYRIGQKNPVIIHPLICRGTIEENIHAMLTRKRDMADKLLSGGLEKLLLHLTPEELLALIGGAP